METLHGYGADYWHRHFRLFTVVCILLLPRRAQLNFCGRGERSFAKLRCFAVMPKGIKKILTLAGVSIFCTRGKAP